MDVTSKGGANSPPWTPPRTPRRTPEIRSGPAEPTLRSSHRPTRVQADAPRIETRLQEGF